MKSISLEYIRRYKQNTHPRTQKAQLNVLIGLLVKGGGILASLFLVPMTLDYLSKDVYGTWLTINSVLTMMSLLDIGISNGLRNKIAEAITKNNIKIARVYVSTAYFIFSSLQLLFISLFLLIFHYVPWQKIFNTTIDLEQLRTVVLLTVIAVAIKLVLDIILSVLFAIQEASLVGVLNLLSNVLILLATYALKYYSSGNLIYLSAVTVISPIIISLLGTFILYKYKLKIYRPSILMIDLKYAKSLLSLGYKFFFIQIAGIVLFYTDNIIITQLFGPTEVTTYNIAFRYFNAINTIFIIAVTPYWSAFTEAYVKGEREWMRQTYGTMQRLWIGLIVIVVAMIFASSLIYKVWIGDRVNIPFILNVGMGLFVVVSCWNSIVAAVINGIGKVKLQLYYAITASIMNVPLSIIFGKALRLGSAGVILATVVSLLICSGFGGIQAKKLINGTAKGVWNQ